MLICPTIFLKMKRKPTPLQRNCRKCHAAIPSQKSENSKNSINFSSHSQLQYKRRGVINDFLLLQHIAYPLTRRSHNSLQVLTTVNQLWCFRARVCNHAALPGQIYIGPRPRAACVKLCVLDNALTTHTRLAIPDAGLTTKLLELGYILRPWKNSALNILFYLCFYYK